MIFLGSLAVALVVERFWPSSFVPAGLGAWIGGALVLASLPLFAAAWRELTRHATSIAHHRPTQAIVASGPYAVSRNPVYVSMALSSPAWPSLPTASGRSRPSHRPWPWSTAW